MNGILLNLIGSILPKGAVRDETTFLILVSILGILVAAAIVLRKTRK
ncbi:MAG: hypothetical protein WAL79_03570 [Nitrososphaeraceae archaeon]